MDCSQIKNPALLTQLLRSGQPADETRVLNCFFELYYAFWCKLANSSLITDQKMPDNQRDEMISSAFNDGLCYFILFIKTKGYEERGATMETLFFEFCKRKLWGALKAYRSYNHKRVNGGLMESFDLAPADGKDEITNERKQREEVQEEQFQKAWGSLGEKCRNLIFWRKIKKWNNEQIAAQLNIDPGSVTNEVYRCMEKIKKIVEEPIRL